MKNTHLYGLFVFALLLIGSVLPSQAQAADITVTCTTTCTPTYSSYVGTVTLVLACNATSPASFTGQLTVNGVSTPVHTQNCLVPKINFDAAPTQVDDGDASTLTWTVTDATSCTASGAADWSGPVAFSGTNSQQVNPSANTTYTLNCTGVDGPASRQATVRVPSGYIAGSSCEIAISGDSCTSLITWASADFFGSTHVSQGSVLFSTTSPSSGGTPRTVDVDNRTFTIEDSGGGFTDSFPVVVTCAPGSVWASGACLPLPVITLQASPNLIRSGSTAEVEVRIDSEFDLTCTMTGGMQETFTHTGSPTIADYARDTRELTSAQIVQIECIADAYPVVRATAQERVDVIPTVQEI